MFGRRKRAQLNGGAATSRAATWPSSIREINDLPPEEKRAVYAVLVPDWVYTRFHINRDGYNAQGQRAIYFRCPTGSSAVEISVYHHPAAHDPVLYLHLGDTFNAQLIVLLMVVNDPEAPRFNIDVDENGHPTLLGTNGRNIPEEIRAMRAGLAPGQVRRGLRVFRTAIPIFERFVARMGHDIFFAEPLFYHNAIILERYGFAYSRGLQKMKAIHARFQPGGDLHERLDGSTPFRHPDAWRTIFGRSWAIHDGIMGAPLSGLQMYKRVGVDAGVCTFPDAHWV